MICDRCHVPIVRSDNQDQPLCRWCLRHLRAGGGWALDSATPEGARDPIRCPLDLLDFRALIVFGEVPRYPNDSDFHGAASDVAHHEDDPAAHWRIEAVRWLMQNHGKPLDEGRPVIAGRTAARLWKLAERKQREAEAAT